MTRADLSKANLAGAHLANADLTEARLFDALLTETDLTDAKLVRSNLAYVRLERSILWHTDLSGANLQGALLAHTYFHNVDFHEVKTFSTHFDNVDLSSAVGLETIQHLGPSTIGIDSIYRSQGNIPQTFLRGCGLPDDFINYVRSLVTNAIEYYSCFISYSSKDQKFADRLYNDLQANGVRCWFAPKDLKIGAELRPSFDEAIRLHDKLMILLSENSIKSRWVEDEVETALEKERQQNRIVLFPIRLDDTVLKTDQAWAAKIRRTRHIGEFRDWKNHDSYEQGLERLLRDLKAEDQARTAQSAAPGS
jgi:hypothetical protein